MLSHQALRSFCAALASGQLGPLMGQFGVSDEAMTAAAQGGKWQDCTIWATFKIDIGLLVSLLCFLGLLTHRFVNTEMRFQITRFLRSLYDMS